MYHFPLIYFFLGAQQMMTAMMNYPATIMKAATESMQQGTETT